MVVTPNPRDENEAADLITPNDVSPVAEPVQPAESIDARPERETTPGRRLRRPAVFDAAICLVYGVFAGWLTAGLWPNPGVRAIAANPTDQALDEWFLSHGVQIWHGDFSLIDGRLNVPDGINLMTNVALLLYAIVTAPVTALFGSAVSFALIITVNLAGTASAWYLFLARGLRLRREAALIGGALAGFGPGMISQSNSHPNLSGQFLVPAIVWFVLRIVRAESRRTAVTSGVWLGLLVAAQLLLGEEVLFLTVLTLVLFGLFYAVGRPRLARPMLPRLFTGAGVAFLVTLPLVAYPLWVQFFGRLHTSRVPFNMEYFGVDLATILPFSPLSIAGKPESDLNPLSSGPAEYNSYFGWSVLLVFALCLVWMWRAKRYVVPLVAMALTGAVMTYISLGVNVNVNGFYTGLPSLYRAVANIPVVSSSLPTRYALALIPLIAITIALTLDTTARSRRPVRVAALTLVAAALVPTIPAQIPTESRAAVPVFVTSGDWRQCAPEGGVIVPVPLPTPTEPDVMRWPAAANQAFGIPQGYFQGPYGENGSASMGVLPQPSSSLLADVDASGEVPPITDDTRQQMREDLAFWKADCVALAHGDHEQALKDALEQLLGPGTRIDDVLTWKVT
jgi:hypothetical protein